MRGLIKFLPLVAAYILFLPTSTWTASALEMSGICTMDGSDEMPNSCNAFASSLAASTTIFGDFSMDVMVTARPAPPYKPTVFASGQSRVPCSGQSVCCQAERANRCCTSRRSNVDSGSYGTEAASHFIPENDARSRSETAFILAKPAGVASDHMVRLALYLASCAWASNARAFASADSVESSAMRSWAFAVPSLAVSESATARLVSSSFVETRSSENLSLIEAVLIVPQVPTATKKAPVSNTPLKISNQRLAASGDSNIRSLLDLLFGAFCVVWSAVMFEAYKRIRDSWRRFRR